MSTNEKRKTRELPHGETVFENIDSEYISSPQQTVHKRETDENGELEYSPKCGQVLGKNSLWSGVDADSDEEAVLKFNLKPCSQCFNGSYKLNRYRKEIHSSIVMETVELPEKYEKYRV